MFFFLSKTLNYFTMPLVIVSLLLIISLIVKGKKWKTRTRVAGIILLLLFSNDFISNEAMRLWEIPATPYAEIKKSYEWGILLTGVTKAETEPYDRVHFSSGADRATHTVQLYKLGLIKKVLISGGSGRLIDIGQREANDLTDALVLMGVRKQDILVESESRNTHESAVNVKALLQSISRPEDCLLITSGFHMRRSLGCFANEEWPVDAFSADIITHKRKITFDILFIPKYEALNVWQHVIKESIGYVSYKVAGYI